MYQNDTIIRVLYTTANGMTFSDIDKQPPLHFIQNNIDDTNLFATYAHFDKKCLLNDDLGQIILKSKLIKR